jgi:hypothetical protein
MVAKLAVESVLQGAGQGEVLQKQGGTWANFGSDGADRRPLAVLQMKIISAASRAGETRVQGFPLSKPEGNSH